MRALPPIPVGPSSLIHKAFAGAPTAPPDSRRIEHVFDEMDAAELQPVPEPEEPRQQAVDVGCAPGPMALLLAASLDRSRLAPESTLDLIGLVERSLTVVQSLRAELIADYAEQAPTDPRTWDEQADMDWHREQLAAVCRTSPYEADVRCRTSLALRVRLPGAAAAVRSGALPWAQAVVLARESDGLDPAASEAVERTVLGDPRAVSVRQVRDATRAAVESVRPRMADERERNAHAVRSLQFWPHDDGTTDLFARLTTDGAITVAAALEPLAGSQGPDDERTAEQRRADALVALAIGGTEPQHPGRPTVSLTLLARLDPSRPVTGGLTQGLLAGGHLGATPLAPETLRRLTCEAAVAAATVTADGAVGPESARRRFPDAAMRRRLEARDQRCAFPGCPVAARRCHAHHIRHWSQGGPTTDENLVLTCHRHHNAVHEGGWTMRGPATRLRWRDPHGREYAAPVAAATIPRGLPDQNLLDMATPDPPAMTAPDPPAVGHPDGWATSSVEPGTSVDRASLCGLPIASPDEPPPF